MWEVPASPALFENVLRSATKKMLDVVFGEAALMLRSWRGLQACEGVPSQFWIEVAVMGMKG